jgi:hypothetical protein
MCPPHLLDRKLRLHRVLGEIQKKKKFLHPRPGIEPRLSGYEESRLTLAETDTSLEKM